MSRPAGVKSTTPQTEGTRFADPTMVDALTESPCKCRPETLMRCPLYDQSKLNIICYACSLLGRGPKILTVDELEDVKNEGWLRANYDTKPQITRHPCTWPHGCSNGAVTAGEFAHRYCRAHSMLIRQRRKAGRRGDQLLTLPRPGRGL